MDNIEKNIIVVDDMLISSENSLDNSLDTHQTIDKPYVGQRFYNLEDVKEFYLSYGSCIGFSVCSYTTKFRLNKITK